ncbi:hypothetical protein JK159_02230 [Weissella minor]|uniref:hypothetical protein n=1 Tax=Weissella minor TaxID=1620 RepID=UPI001BAEBC27|nr:hypothetical protein [Weissella minor]MBS0949200.1 hypothetical protein [Weissella minor]
MIKYDAIQQYKRYGFVSADGNTLLIGSVLKKEPTKITVVIIEPLARNGEVVVMPITTVVATATARKLMKEAHILGD